MNPLPTPTAIAVPMPDIQGAMNHAILFAAWYIVVHCWWFILLALAARYIVWRLDSASGSRRRRR